MTLLNLVEKMPILIMKVNDKFNWVWEVVKGVELTGGRSNRTNRSKLMKLDEKERKGKEKKDDCWSSLNCSNAAQNVRLIESNDEGHFCWMSFHVWIMLLKLWFIIFHFWFHFSRSLLLLVFFCLKNFASNYNYANLVKLRKKDAIVWFRTKFPLPLLFLMHFH